MIERYVPGKLQAPVPIHKGPRLASTYRAFRRNTLKGNRVRVSKAERLKQGPAKYIERKE